MMSVVKRIKGKVRNYFANIVGLAVRDVMEDMLPLIAQLIEFRNSSPMDKHSFYDHTQDPFAHKNYCEHLKDKLSNIGVPVEEVDIDVLDFESWLADCPGIKVHYQEAGVGFIQKCLEHYLSMKHLNITNEDVYIDIGADFSPWADILNKKGVRSYKLDLAYPEGIHGNSIGANAANTNLPDSFASVLSAQNTYEHFMGDADIGFISEANRLLSENGRYGIVPLYLDETHYVAISPYCNRQDIEIESEAKIVWRDDGFKVPFSRHYSPEVFKKRGYSNIPKNMKGKVLYFRNLADVMKHYQGQRIYCFFMFLCEKLERV